LFPKDTYKTMLAEDFTPAGIAQIRNEARAVATAVLQYRDQPPQPLKCLTILLAATRPPMSTTRTQRQPAGPQHQLRYVENLLDARYEDVGLGHFIQAEQPHLVARRTRQLLDLTTDPRAVHLLQSNEDAKAGRLDVHTSSAICVADFGHRQAVRRTK